jgi:xylulokinase
MDCLLGIDVGTSGAKVLLIRQDGTILDSVYREYKAEEMKANWAEQDPEVWWQTIKGLLFELRSRYGTDYRNVVGIGFSGQMHGLVMVDKNWQVIRPAITWLDQRSEKEVEDIYRVIPKDEFHQTTLNRASSGFALPSLLWVKKNEPENFKKIYKIMQPKDYIRMKLIGEIATDMSDASSTVAFYTSKRRWANEIIWVLGLNRDIFPDCFEGDTIAGTVLDSVSDELGLRRGVQVVYGGGDQPMQGVGNGAVSKGLMYTNIGTSGWISIFSDKPVHDTEYRTHTLCHAIKKGWSIFGATLSSGLALSWLKNKILLMEDYAKMSSLVTDIPAGSEGVLFLPYLAGERTPHFDNDAKAVFHGLTLSHDRRHMIRAVMEGVVYSLKESFILFQDMGYQVKNVIAAGGGSRSDVWVQMQADIFGKPVKVIKVNDHACLGAAMVASVACGLFDSYQSATNAFIKFKSKVFEPDIGKKSVYEDGFMRFKQLYIDNYESFRR